MPRAALVLCLLLAPRLAAADEVDPPQALTGAAGSADAPAPVPGPPAPKPADVVDEGGAWPRELVLGGLCLLVAVAAGLSLRRR